MSFTVTLYDFQKRHNSTRRPQGGSWDQTGVLREGSSLITPTIAFEFATDFSPMNNSYNLKFNYAYVAKFARYYWITDWTYEGGLWHAAMKVDVLATYRPQILAASAFVAYDDYVENNDIPDPRLSVLTNKAVSREDVLFTKLGQNDSGGGVIILMVTGKNSTAAFAMSAGDIANLMNNVTSWASATLTDPASSYPGTPNDTFGEALWNSLKGSCAWWKRFAMNISSNGNAAENLRSAVQLPIDIADVPGTNQQICLGQYESNVYAKKISSRILYDQCEVTIPWRWTNDWRNNEPYTEIYLFIPFVGNMKMPNGDLMNETKLKIYATVDLISGDAIFRVYAEPSDFLVASYSANIGASYPIGASNISPGQTVTGLSGAVGAIAAGAKMGGAAGAAVGALGAITGIIAANTPNSSSVGGGGGGAAQGVSGRCMCTVVTHDVNQQPADPDGNAIMGTPTMRVVSLAHMTGYVETRGAAITCDATATEHAELNALLDSGIYIETGG